MLPIHSLPQQGILLPGSSSFCQACLCPGLSGGLHPSQPQGPVLSPPVSSALEESLYPSQPCLLGQLAGLLVHLAQV